MQFSAERGILSLPPGTFGKGVQDPPSGVYATFAIHSQELIRLILIRGGMEDCRVILCWLLQSLPYWTSIPQVLSTWLLGSQKIAALMAALSPQALSSERPTPREYWHEWTKDTHACTHAHTHTHTHTQLHESWDIIPFFLHPFQMRICQFPLQHHRQHPLPMQSAHSPHY